jgi:hypothetical protein
MDVSPPSFGSLAFDKENNQVVLYIGSIEKSGNWHKQNQIWSFDIATETWKDLSSDSDAPRAKLGAALEYDQESDRMVLFGGLDPVDWVFSNETWSFDLNSNTWELMNPAESPPERNYPAFVYNSAKDRFVLFGGGTDVNLNDTWIYDLNSDVWIEVTPEKSPPARTYAALTYDPDTDRIILFGGINNLNQPLTDIWAFDLDSETWEEPPSLEGPAARGWHSMSTLEGSEILMFGGGPSRNKFTDETWLYDIETNTWTELGP